MDKTYQINLQKTLPDTAIMKILSELKKQFIKLLNQVPVTSEYFGSPRKCCSFYEFAVKNKQDVILAHNGECLELTAPRLNINGVPPQFQKIRKRSQRQNFVIKIYDGRVWGKNGAVITNDDQFLFDVSREFGISNPCKDHSVYHATHLGKCNYIEGNIAVIATAGADVYYHWMIDVIPRFLLLKESGAFDDIDYFILNYKALPFQKESLKKLGIAEQKIIHSDRRKFHIKASCLYVPSLLSELNQVNKFEIKLLQHFWLSNKQYHNPTRNIYISRRSNKTRTIFNETDLAPLLEKNNFEIIELENKTITEQIKIFQEAKIIMGPHGSAFTNIIFAQPGTVLIDIMPATNLVPCFYNIAKQMEIEYFGFIGASQKINDNPKNDNIILHRNEFEVFLENILNYQPITNNPTL